MERTHPRQEEVRFTIPAFLRKLGESKQDIACELAFNLDGCYTLLGT